MVTVDLDNSMNDLIQLLNEQIGELRIKKYLIGGFCPMIDERICVLKARLNLLELQDFKKRSTKRRDKKCLRILNGGFTNSHTN